MGSGERKLGLVTIGFVGLGEMRLSLVGLGIRDSRRLGELKLCGLRSRGNRPAEIKPCGVIRSSGTRRSELKPCGIRSRGNMSAEIKPCGVIRSSRTRRSETKPCGVNLLDVMRKMLGCVYILLISLLLY